MTFKHKLKRIGFAFCVFMVVCWSLAPFLWFVITSVKTPEEIAARPPSVLPASIHPENYSRLSTHHRFFIPIRNSLVVSGVTTLITIPIAALAAYAIARLRFRGRIPILSLILTAAMFPQITIAHTLERWLFSLGWINTFQGLVVPYISLSLPLAVWILASFFREFPPDLEDAARLDGCGPLGILFRIFFPVAAPAVFTAAILTFIYSWNEFFFASFIVDREQFRTVPVAIVQFQGRYNLPWGEVAAASVISTLPLIIMVLAFQKRIISGLTAGAVKE